MPSEVVKHFIRRLTPKFEPPRISKSQRHAIARLALILTAIVVSTVAVHYFLLSNWRITHGSANILFTSRQASQSRFIIQFYGDFNGTGAKVMINPYIPSNTTFLPYQNQITLDLGKTPAGQIINITIDHIRVTNSTLQLDFPFGSRGATYVEAIPVGFNATTYVTSDILAQTDYGEVRVYSVSLGIHFGPSGVRTYVDYPDYWHALYGVGRFYDLFVFCSFALLIGGVAYEFGWVGKNYPFATLFVVLLATSVYLHFGTAYSLIYGQFGRIPSLWTIFCISSFFHESYEHLAGNLSTIVPLILVMDSGLRWKSWKTKAGLLLSSVYLSSPFSSIVLNWNTIPPGGFGFSLAPIWLGLLFIVLLTISWKRIAKCWRLVAYSFLVGYCFLDIAYGWPFNALEFSSSQYTVGLAEWHILTTIPAVFYYGLIQIIGSRLKWTWPRIEI